jgi:hypothetical protein
MAESAERRISERKRQHRVELAAAVLLGLAGVAAAWSTYQAARWGGVQAARYSQAGAARVEAARASSQADQLRAIDIATFMAWVEAYADGDARLEAFYADRFRPEFRPAFDAWIAARPAENPDAAPTPFALEEYRLAALDEAESLTTEAEQKFRDGEEANEWSDAYVLNAAMLATVLFLAGIAQPFRLFPVQIALLILATGFVSWGLYTVAVLPKA